RAAISLAAEKNSPLGARRWLVYPPVLLVSVPLFLGVMLWPIVAAPIVNEEFVNPAEKYRDYVAAVDADGKVTFKTDPERRDAKGALLAWWAVVGLTVWAFPRWPAAVFCPLFGRGDGSRGGRLFAFAAIGVVIWAGFAWQLLEAAGVG